MYTYIELAEFFEVSVPRVKNLLCMAGLLHKKGEVTLNWEVTEKGREYFKSGVWSDQVLEIIEDMIDEQESTLIADKSHVDRSTCQNCWESKPYYEFQESKRNESGLSKWCKKCLARL